MKENKEKAESYIDKNHSYEVYEILNITNAGSLISTPDSSRLAISDPGAGHVKPIITAKCYFIGISGPVSSGRTIRWNSEDTTVFSYSDIRRDDNEMSTQQFLIDFDCYFILEVSTRT